MNKTLLKIVFNLALAALVIAAMEAASRAIQPVDPRNTREVPGLAAWADWIVYDQDLFWRLRPGIMSGDERLTNDLGLRGPDVPTEKSGEFRILSLGESSTFARRLSYAQTYSARVGLRLKEVDGRSVRIVNAGVPAYTLFQGVTFVREHGLALEPDAILLYFGYNDFLPSARRGLDPRSDGRSSLSDRELFEQRQRIRSRLGYWLSMHSNLFRLVQSRMGRNAEPVEIDSSRRRVPDADRRLLLEELLGLCSDRGIRLVVIVPWYREFEDHAPLLRTFARENGVAIVDLPLVLAGDPERRKAFFVDRFHPNAGGHARIARAIASRLRSLWIAKSSDRP